MIVLKEVNEMKSIKEVKVKCLTCKIPIFITKVIAQCEKGSRVQLACGHEYQFRNRERVY